MTADLVAASDVDGSTLGLLPMALAKPVTAAELFSPGIRETIMAAISAHVATVPLDASTEFARTQLQVLKTKLVRSRTAVERMRKEHIADAKKIVAAAGEIGDAYEADFKALESVVDAPLAAYKQIEKDRVAGHNGALQALRDLAVFPAGAEPAVAEIEARIADIQPATQRNWQEFSTQASEAWQAAGATLKALLENTKRREAEAAELAELRSMKAEADRVADHKSALITIKHLAVFADGSGSGANGEVTAADVAARILAMGAPDTRDWQEFADTAATVKAAVIAKLRQHRDDLEAAEAEDRVKRETEVAEAAATAAERKAQADGAQALEDAAKATRDAEAREAKAIADRIAGEKAAEAALAQARIDAKAAQNAAVAKALNAQREQIEAERAAPPPTASARDRNPADRHDEAARISMECGGPPPRTPRPADASRQREVHATALKAFVDGGMQDKAARLAVTMIAAGKIPAVSISYEG